MGLWSNKRILALTMVRVGGSSLYKNFMEVSLVLPQLAVNWVETVYPLQNASGVGTSRILRKKIN